MSDPNLDILTGIRSLLLLWSELTDIVYDRIRPESFHSTDANQPALMLELSEGTQQNFLERSSVVVDATLMVTVRAPLATQAAQIAEIIRTRNTKPSTGLDGYSGSAGSGYILGAERQSFSNGKELDTDGNETENYISIQVYQLLFQLGG